MREVFPVEGSPINTCSLIKKIRQTAVINIVFQCIFIKLDVSYASQHTFSKVTVTIFENYIYIVNIRGLEPRLVVFCISKL